MALFYMMLVFLGFANVLFFYWWILVRKPSIDYTEQFRQKRAKEYREAAIELIQDAIIINESAKGEMNIEKRFRLLSNSSLCRRSAREYNELADIWEKSIEEEEGD